MEATSYVLALATILALGLSAGALLEEGALLLPGWRAQSPRAFLEGYARDAPRLQAFFAPLEVGAALVALAAALARTFVRGRLDTWGFAAVALAVVVLATFPLFFQGANAAFARGAMAPEAVGPALDRWARWHWTRVGVACAAPVAAAVALG